MYTDLNKKELYVGTYINCIKVSLIQIPTDATPTKIKLTYKLADHFVGHGVRQCHDRKRSIMQTTMNAHEIVIPIACIFARQSLALKRTPRSLTFRFVALSNVCTWSFLLHIISTTYVCTSICVREYVCVHLIYSVHAIAVH